MKLFIKYVILSIVGVACGHLAVFLLGGVFDLTIYFAVPGALTIIIGLLELLNWLKIIEL